ncbi:MAG: class I SAM-dependent methyltransferase [Melioribacteraceae bacterium]|nr:class I SAM-dependent methyltransferase [Melioribacteraceae bacterium]
MEEDEIRKREVFNKYLELSAKDVKEFFNDHSKFEFIKCPACNSGDIKKAFSKNSFFYDECEKCNTVFVNPRPPLKSLNKFYSDSPSTTFWINEFFLPVAEIRREKIFKPRAEFISDFIGFKENLLIGDVGAGFGLFLEEFRKLNSKCKLTAIEPSVEMAEICKSKGLDVINTLLEQFDFIERKFDLLTSFELFEHLHNPEGFLRKIYDLLNNGGFFIFTTLNGLGFDIQLLWEKSKSISPPHHLNFFNPWSIKILLQRIGFQIVEISTPGKLDWNIIEGGLKNENIFPGRFFNTVSKYGSKEAKTDLQKWIADNNFSSHMRVVVKKNIRS